MDMVILIAGIAGLGVAAYAFVSLTVDAVRSRQFLDVAVAVALAVAVVCALIAWGDRLVR